MPMTIHIPNTDAWDEVNKQFIVIKECSFEIEHSLISLSKWESKWKKPLLREGIKLTDEETIDYIRCMTITKNVNPNAYYVLTNKQIEEIKEYMEDKHTATTFGKDAENGPGGKKQIVTSEIIYYWMIQLGIPSEYQKWHLERLLALIKVCSIKNGKPKRMSNKEILARNKAENAARRKAMNSRG